MTKLINALEARTKLGKLLNRVSKKNERYLINRRGHPTAVVLSVKDYLENIIEAPKLLIEIQKEAALKGKDRITPKEIEKEIQTYRKEKTKKKSPT